MAEKKIVVDGLELHYDGIFNLDALLKTIDKYASERGYGKSGSAKNPLS